MWLWQKHFWIHNWFLIYIFRYFFQKYFICYALIFSFFYKLQLDRHIIVNFIFVTGISSENVIFSANRAYRRPDGGSSFFHPGLLHPGFQLGVGTCLLPSARAARCHAGQGIGLGGKALWQRWINAGKSLFITIYLNK